MYAVMGVTGKVGGAVAAALLESGCGVRAIMRDAAKAHTWTRQGCEIALANVENADALSAAFQDVDGVFVMLPPIFDPRPGFPEAKSAIAALTQSLKRAAQPKIVCLSTIGAGAEQPNLLNQLGLLEQALQPLPAPIAFLRAAWFLDNAVFDAASARSAGVIESFLQPLDKQYPMVAAKDVGCVAAELLRDTWHGHRVVELEGPRRVTPNEIAQAFAAALGSPVAARVVQRQDWEKVFLSVGMQNPTPRIQMLDGFNQGWIQFSDGGRHARHATTSAEQVIASIVDNM
jgi:NAD(P)H dehydrogenase (quinone)